MTKTETAKNFVGEVKPNLLQLTVQCTIHQLQNFFRCQDDAKSILREILNRDVDLVELLTITLAFLKRSYNSERDKINFSLNYEDLPKSALNSVLQKQEISIIVEASEHSKLIILKNITDLHEILATKYSMQAFKVDNYLILLEAFKYFLAHSKHFFDHFDIYDSSVKVPQKVKVLCDVCDDEATQSVPFTEVNLCGKCKDFFHDIMTTREVLSLRCRGKNDLCQDELGSIDIRCRACRFSACKRLGLVENYYHFETPHLANPKECIVCSATTGDNLPPIVVVFALPVCMKCVLFMDNQVSNENVPDVKCKRGFWDCHETSEIRCDACNLIKIKKIGFFKLYEARKQNIIYKAESLRILPNYCIICNARPIKDIWMGLFCCLTCRNFVRDSIQLGHHGNFCCPSGECGKLCKIGPSQKTCNYCWFRRSETEGLVDRYLISRGNSFLWDKRDQKKLEGSQVSNATREEAEKEIEKLE